MDAERTGIIRRRRSKMKVSVVGIEIVSKHRVVLVGHPLVWQSFGNMVNKRRGPLLSAVLALACVESIAYRIQESPIALKSLLGMIVRLFTTAVPEGFNDVSEAVAFCRPYIVVHCMILDEIIECFFTVTMFLYFVELNRRFVVCVQSAGRYPAMLFSLGGSTNQEMG